MKLLISKLGMIDYQEALKIQEKLLKLRQENKIKDTMLLLEHPPTLTLGVRANYHNILTPQEVLKTQGVNIYKVNRGGDITYHGPGQIVGYPILNLNYHGRDISIFFNKIEETFIKLLKYKFGITACTIPKCPGVWINNEKITAIGVAFKKWVSMHGFAFNVNTNLEHFNWINPCGFTDKGVTSLEKLLGSTIDLKVVNNYIIEYFSKEFNLEPEILTKQDLLAMMGRE